MATKNNRRTRMTRMLLKTALIELMQTKPISKITIKDICIQADLSRSTFYLHYQDQYDLLENIESEIFDNVSNQIREVHPETDAYHVILEFARYIQNEGILFKTLLCQQENSSFEKEFILRMKSVVLTTFPPKEEDEEIDYEITYMMHGALNVLKLWIEKDFDISDARVAHLILSLCQRTY